MRASKYEFLVSKKKNYLRTAVSGVGRSCVTCRASRCRCKCCFSLHDKH
ncbi:hypothetical protein BVRB_001640 [Beta vulgaris subsp. vulgaris]|uniref:Uncharacterized protein n=1 Tax=Beta vulgaris subsp. vulgaris TaxID=3555 RepID=A0A0J8B880_BETVV|nr:hypothetical protein BVRB_001640 [Beta vulgaris subsp. vulgaris]